MRRRRVTVTMGLVSEGVPVEFSLAQLMERMRGGVMVAIAQVFGTVVVPIIKVLVVQVSQWMMALSMMMVASSILGMEYSGRVSVRVVGGGALVGGVGW